MRDAGGVQGADRGPDLREQSSVSSSAGARRAAARGRRRDEQGHVGAADAGAFDTRCGDAGPLGPHQRVADVLDLLHAGAEDREARLLEHHAPPELGADPGVALVATEGVDAEPMPSDIATSNTEERTFCSLVYSSDAIS